MPSNEAPHQARARWFHQRTRLNRDNALVS
jgi:hypothetical protein